MALSLLLARSRLSPVNCVDGLVSDVNRNQNKKKRRREKHVTLYVSSRRTAMKIKSKSICKKKKIRIRNALIYSPT